MTAGVPSPSSSSSLGKIRSLGTATYTTAGMFTVPFPIGTKLVRFQLRGGGGGGGLAPGNGNGGTGGGQGGLQRRLIPVSGSSAVLVIGPGGTGGISIAVQPSDGGNSTFLGFTAQGGKHGVNGVSGGQPGVGAAGDDGAEVPLGSGSYNGLNGNGRLGGGNTTTNGTESQGAAGTLGAGGNGGVQGGTTTTGGKGGDGVLYLECFG